MVPPGPLAQRSIKESWAQWSLSRGVESVPESITEYLQQSGRVQLHRETAVKQISPSASGWEVSEETIHYIYLNFTMSVMLTFSWFSMVCHSPCLQNIVTKEIRHFNNSLCAQFLAMLVS